MDDPIPTMHCPKCGDVVHFRLDCDDPDTTFEYADISDDGNIYYDGEIVEDVTLIFFCICTQKRLPLTKFDVRENHIRQD